MSCAEAAGKWGISERRVQNFVRGTAYRVFQNLAICGSYQRTQKSPQIKDIKERDRLNERKNTTC